MESPQRLVRLSEGIALGFEGRGVDVLILRSAIRERPVARVLANISEEAA